MNIKQQMVNKLPPTPFKMIGDSVKSGVKKVGAFLDKEFIQPSRVVNQKAKQQDAQWKQQGADLKAGRTPYVKGK